MEQPPRFFAPAIHLMAKLRYQQKILLMGGIILVVFLLLMFMMFQEFNKRIHMTEKEILSAHYMQPVLNIMVQLQKHRGLGNRFLNGDQSTQAGLEAARTALSHEVTQLETLQSQEKFQFLEEHTHFVAFKQKWDLLQKQFVTLQPKESFAQHTVLISEIQQWISDIADRGGLALDPEADTYYVIFNTISILPDLTERIGQARGLASGIAASRNVKNPQKQSLLLIPGVIQYDAQLYQQNLDKIQRHNPFIFNRLVSSSRDLIEKITHYTERLHHDILETESITVSPQVIFDEGTEIITLAVKQIQMNSPILDQLLKDRKNYYQIQLLITLGASVITIMLSIYLGVGFYYCVYLTVLRLKTAAHCFEKGELNTRIELKTHDELADIAEAFNKMAASFSVVIRDVNQTVTDMHQISETLLESSTTLRARAHHQSEATTTNAAALEEMSGSIRDIAEHADETEQLSHHSEQSAEQGNQIVLHVVTEIENIAKTVHQALSSLHLLGQRSGAITEIVSVIAEIADRTNLLALNAAIEAARAGEAGRGFSIVADEIRQLAENTSKATKQISQVIHDINKHITESTVEITQGNQQITESVQYTNQSASLLEKITLEAKHVLEYIKQITHATHEQKEAAYYLAQSLDDMARIAEANAADSDHTVTLATQLQNASLHLHKTVQHFQI